MRWQKISLSILTAMLLAWAAFSATAADGDTDKSLIIASAKIEEERELTAAKLLARSQEFNETYEATACQGFSLGRRMPTQRLVCPFESSVSPSFTGAPSLL